MNWLFLVALSGPLVYSVFNSGGVSPAVWNPSLLALAALSLAYFLFRRFPTVPLDRLSFALLLAVLLLSAFQLVPLPLSLLRQLSPLRFADLEAARFVLPSFPQYAPLSSSPYETAQYLLTLTGCAVTFFVIRSLSLAESTRPWIVAWPLLVIGTLEAALGILQSYGEGGEGFARGTYANRDHFSALLEMIFPFAALYPFAILQRTRNRHESPAFPALKACVLLGAAALLLVGVIHSLSRMGFLVILAVLFLCGAVSLVVRGERANFKAPIPLWRRALPVALVAAVVALGFIYLPTDPLIARFSEFARTDDITADIRAQIWRDTASMVKSYPLTGCGWGAYQYAFLRFKTVAPMYTVDYAHNDFLQILVEAGPLIFILGLFFLARLLFRLLIAAEYSYSADERYLAIACAGSITAILLHSFVDFNLYVPSNALLFAWVLGIAAVHLRPSRKS